MFFHLGFTPLNPSGSTTVGSDLSFSDLSQVTFLKTRGGFYASKYGFITGRFGVFLKSTDLGTTWKKSTLDITDGKGICFIDTLNGFICGSNGDLLKTIDGGSNWTKLTTHLRTTLSRIYFKDKLTGWIIGPNGLLIRTDNGGGFGAAENIRETNNLPNTFSLSQNFPNPFNPGTTINYSLSSEGHVSIKVYNILGEEISTIVNEKKGAGNYNIYFNGIGLPSGIYFYRIQAGDFSETRKMILLK
jgi:hypothetical protein